jgi:hypothetical protein
MYKILNNIDVKVIATLATDAEFIHFMRSIAVENGDEELSIIKLQEAKDYLSNYCNNLTLQNLEHIQFCVAFTTVKDLDNFKDEFRNFEDESEAKTFYDSILKMEDLYTANFCRVIETTG